MYKEGRLMKYPQWKIGKLMELAEMIKVVSFIRGKKQ